MVEVINGVERTYAYTYDNDRRVSTVAIGDTVNTYNFDGYGRINTQVTTDGSSTILTDTYDYREPGEGLTSTQVEALSITAGGYGVTHEYGYDANGNITSITSGGKETTYVYDALNQLTRENNQAADKTWVWTYDHAGNILSKAEYEYTTASLEGAAPTDTISYAYTDENWGDLLTSYDGVAITHDEIGNPLNDGTWTYTWENGRQLASMSDGTTTWNYEYNADGLRTSRTNGTTTYEYVYNGSSLVQLVVNYATESETASRDVLYFTPDTVIYNDTIYYYVTNIQGDVIAILNGDGNAVVTYSYDAWGNIIDIAGSMMDTLGALNPLRYRGYVYDSETSLYYLQSRYYNPEMGRFLNADGYTSTGQGILGNNMFAYCNNNPVKSVDISGCMSVGALGQDSDTMLSIDYYGDGTTAPPISIPLILPFDQWLTSETVSIKALTARSEEIENAIVKSMAISLAKSKKTQFNNNIHIHHIVAQRDPRALPAQIIMRKVFLETGVQDPANLIPVSAKIHARLHTNLYYIYVNTMITVAYASGGDSAAMRKQNVETALGVIKVFISALEAL